MFEVCFPLRFKKYTLYNYMYLKWTSVCYKCEAPIKPRVVVRGRINKSFFLEYTNIRPLFLANNMLCYSFVGLKLEKVCYACFINKVKIGPKSLRSREIGHIRNFAPRSKAKTEAEIVQWFEGLLRRAYVNSLNTTHAKSV